MDQLGGHVITAIRNISSYGEGPVETRKLQSLSMHYDPSTFWTVLPLLKEESGTKLVETIVSKLDPYLKSDPDSIKLEFVGLLSAMKEIHQSLSDFHLADALTSDQMVDLITLIIKCTFSVIPGIDSELHYLYSIADNVGAMIKLVYQIKKDTCCSKCCGIF
jgi:hypothetical protein